MFTNLIEFIRTMPDEAACREFVAQQRWEGGKAVCPYCNHNKCYVIENGKRYKCGAKTCYKKFSVITGTIMEASNIPLIKWLTAFYLVTAHKKGISSYQLGRDLKIAQKNAWFMLHRIREALRIKGGAELDNVVEIDEVYIGGKVGNMSKSKRKKLRDSNSINEHKTMVMGLLERGGNLKLIPIGNSNNLTAIQPTVKDNVDNDAVLITDSLSSYNGLINHYAGHEVVNHSGQEYVRDGVIHTNSIEGAFSLLKRSIIGIYHQVTPKHLARYCDETMYRYNLRKMTDADRFKFTLTQVEGRLTWKALINTEDKRQKRVLINDSDLPAPTSKPGNRTGRPVYQIKDGEIIARYNSMKEAAEMTGLDRRLIYRVVCGKNITTGGFQWKYA